MFVELDYAADGWDFQFDCVLVMEADLNAVTWMEAETVSKIMENNLFFNDSFATAESLNFTSICTTGNSCGGGAYRTCHGGELKSVGICIIGGGTPRCEGKLSTFRAMGADGSDVWINCKNRSETIEQTDNRSDAAQSKYN